MLAQRYFQGFKVQTEGKTTHKNNYILLNALRRAWRRDGVGNEGQKPPLKAVFAPQTPPTRGEAERIC